MEGLIGVLGWLGVITMPLTKILWVSRHKPLPSQVAWLKERFGEIEIIFSPITFGPNPAPSAKQVFDLMRGLGCREVVVVAPLSVIDHICRLEVRPLWAEMNQVDPREAEVEVGGRFYRFVRFRRVKRLALEFEEI